HLKLIERLFQSFKNIFSLFLSCSLLLSYSYTFSLPSRSLSPLSPTIFLLSLSLQYSIPIVKYDRNGFKARPRQLILTQTAAYVVDDAKIKQRVLYTTLKGVSVSTLSDGIIIFHIPSEDDKQKGDLIMQCDHLFEALTKLSVVANKQSAINVVQGSVKFQMKAGKEGIVEFSSGQESMVYKDKNGHLMVVSTRTRAR
uniref:TH1 domain-containing protein n=1 Tax=Oncorhynchus kisutch TaxID=8019 RepID=A0A8C7KG04_ONCKI